MRRCVLYLSSELKHEGGAPECQLWAFWLNACCRPIRVTRRFNLSATKLNIHRVLEPIGYIPPAEVEAEANYYRQLASQATEVAA